MWEPVTSVTDEENVTPTMKGIDCFGFHSFEMWKWNYNSSMHESNTENFISFSFLLHKFGVLHSGLKEYAWE